MFSCSFRWRASFFNLIDFNYSFPVPYSFWYRLICFLCLRFWLVGQRQENGLYDILFCHISRKEDFDFFLFINKAFQGTAYVLQSTPQALINVLPERVRRFLHQGMIEEGVEREEPSMYAHRELTQQLGDRLTEYELIEMLIERGNLVPKSDGTLALEL